MSNAPSIRTGIASGTLLSIVPAIGSADILRTVALATIGAVTSFIVTLVLRKLTFRKRKQ